MKFKQCKRNIIDLRITAKPHAHLLTLTKHMQTFKKISIKLLCLYALVEIETIID